MMGLTMSQRRAVTKAIATRYKRAGLPRVWLTPDV